MSNSSTTDVINFHNKKKLTILIQLLKYENERKIIMSHHKPTESTLSKYVFYKHVVWTNYIKSMA